MQKSARRWWPAFIALLMALGAGFKAEFMPSVKANSAAQIPPFSQHWAATGQITADDDWSAVPGIEGYLGDGLTSSAGVDPQTITAGSPTTLDVIANQSAPNTLTAGGVAEFELANPVIALQGSGSADAPYLLINLDTTGKTLISVVYTLRDLDASVDNAVQPVALQYRVGNSGDFTNIPAAFVADATSGPYLADKMTNVSVNLPPAAEGQPLVQVRFITSNAIGSDEWVGIDDLRIFDNDDYGPLVYSVTPAPNAYAVPVDTMFTVKFTESVTLDDTKIFVECDRGMSYSVTTNPGVGNYSDTFEIFPSNMTAGDICVLRIPFDAVLGADYGIPLFDFTSTVFPAGCGMIYNPIHLLFESYVTMGQLFIVEGVVTAYTPELGGYFIQSKTPDADETTTEGIFVNDTTHVVTPGERVRLYGRLIEYNSPPGSVGQHYHQKELVLEAGIERCDTGNVIEPAILDLPLASGALEAYEGMLVTIPEPLTVQQNYFLGRFGQLTLAADGRVFNPNNGQGGTEAEAAARMIVLDDGTHSQNPNPVPYYAADGALRAGYTVSQLTGVLDHGRVNAARSDAPDFTTGYPYVHYRLHPTIPPGFISGNPRPSAELSPAVGGEITAAGFNVHNFFMTLDETPYPETSPYDSINSPRGADSAEELLRQRDKLVTALAVLDADVVGLVEIEAWNGADAVDALVEALNGRVGAGTYAAVPDPVGFPYPQKLPAAGGDFIKVALLYKTGSLAPLGPSTMDNDPVYSRVPVAQTFRANADGETFTVVVNHFKSKSDCPTDPLDPNGDSGQGCWNTLRVQQAEQLLTFVQKVQTTSGDPDVLVLGDLNAYAAEDPVSVLTSGGLENLVSGLVPAGQQYSYIFDGQSGYLDHAFATSSLASQTASAAFWHINADEPAVIDYNLEYKPAGLFTANPFRSSDHDPLVVGLDLYTPRPSITTDDLPADFPVSHAVEFHLRAQNPPGSDPLAQAIFHYRISNAVLADIDAFEYFVAGYGWLPMPISQDGTDVTGYFGPIDGFPMPAGYDATTAFRVQFNQPGTHVLTITLDDLAFEPPLTRESFSRTITVQMQLYLPILLR